MSSSEAPLEFESQRFSVGEWWNGRFAHFQPVLSSSSSSSIVTGDESWEELDKLVISSYKSLALTIMASMFLGQ